MKAQKCRSCKRGGLAIEVNRNGYHMLYCSACDSVNDAKMSDDKVWCIRDMYPIKYGLSYESDRTTVRI